VLIQRMRGKGDQYSFTSKEWIFGGLLGLVNFFSIFFLVKTINDSWLSKGSIVCLNNLGVVLLSTLIAIVAFKEKLSRINWIGLALAIVALGMLLV
jgi:uncharacterized membrane protein